MPKSEDPHGDGVFSKYLPKDAWGLYHPVDLSPLVDVLFAHDVRVDEEVSVADAEVLLTGGTFETLQVVDFILHPHGHLVGTDPLVTGGAQTILAKQPVTKKKKKEKLRYRAEAIPEEGA